MIKQLILLFILIQVITATSITNCGTISASGNYELVNDVSSGGSAQCFLFTKNDTYFDCQGYNVNQTVSSSGAFKYSNLHNITVKNCNITNFDLGIDAIDINNSIVQNNTIYPFNLVGISYVKNNSNQYNISILDNFISSGSILAGNAFDFSYIDNLNISNNIINNTNAVLITSTPNNLSLTNNQFSLNDYGIILSESTSVLSSNNNFTNQTYATLTTNGNVFNSTNDKYFQQNNQILATTNGSINYQAYITNNIIYHENSTYTNFSQSKFIYTTGNSILFDSPIPSLIGTNVSFANIHFNTSKLATSFNTYLNSTTFFWSDQQANTSNESTVRLWKYNGTWTLLNSTPNTISNEISFYNMNISDDVNSMMFLLTADPNVFFISPTPANNSNTTDPLTQITFETNFDMNISGNKIQVNNQNYSCAVSGDLRTCTSIFAIPTLYYNETYNLVAYANKSDTIIQSQQPYSFNYFGCGYVNKSSPLISNLNLNNLAYSCFTIIETQNIIFDGYNYSINFFNPIGIRSGIESINSKNITIKNFEINSSGQGIYINLNNNTNLINNSIFNTTDEGLFDDGNINTSILNNTIITEYQYGIITESSLNTTINYNHLEGYSDAQIAISLNNQQLSNINNNYVFGFYTGIENDFSSLVNITNNIITNSTYLTYIYFSNYSNILYNNLTYSLTSIYLQNSDHINISYNLFNESTTTIDIQDSTDNNINNNIIENSTTNAININIASNINITSNQIINSSDNAISSLILNMSNIENNSVFGKQNSNYGLYLVQFFNSNINNNTIYYHNVSAVSVFAINESITNNEFAYATTGLFAGVLSENISIINNTIHDTLDHGFHLQNVNYTNITNITIYNTEHAFELNNSNYTFATAIYTRNATRNLLLTSPTNDVLVLDDGQSFISNFIIDNPQGGYQNYTNISINNTLPQDTNVSLTWHTYISIPTGLLSFKNKFIEQNGNTSLNISFNWLNSETTLIDENKISLWLYNGSWNLINNSPDTINNNLFVFNSQNGIYTLLLYPNASINLINPSNSCYQEFANQSNFCGAIANPSPYSCTNFNTGLGTCNNIFDGNYFTYGEQINCDGTLSDAYMTYSVPSGTNFSSTKWQIAAIETGIEANRYNLSIPSQCQYNTLQLKTESKLNSFCTGTNYFGWFCLNQNTSTWISLKEDIATWPSGLSNAVRPAEEAMFWSLIPTLTTSTIQFTYNVNSQSYPMQCLLYINNTLKDNRSVNSLSNINVNISNFSTGSYNWHVNCSDIFSNSFISETTIFNVVITPPPTPISITPISPITNQSSKNLVFNYSVNGTFTLLQCNTTVDGINTNNQIVNATGYYSFNKTNLTYGIHKWYVKCSNTSNYIFSSSNIQFMLLPPITSNVTFSQEFAFDNWMSTTNNFFSDYGAYIFAILSYAFAYLLTRRLPSTLIAGGIGCFFCYFILSNPIFIAISALSLICGFLYKQVVG